MKNRLASLTIFGVLAAFLPAPALQAAATIVIVNGDDPGVGFNDPTAAAPVGGNTGTTLGQQRLNAFQAAADKWGATLTSSVTIYIYAYWSALTCNSNSAVLGSAGAYWLDVNFANAPHANTWYPGALANALVGADELPGYPQIVAQFNINLGQPGCLDGSPFYLGLDNAGGSSTVDLVTVLEHEFGHGLGFATFTSGSTGQFYGGYGLPSIYDRFLYDPTINKTWSQMTDSERMASALNFRRLAWNGPNVVGAAPSVLSQGTPLLTVTAPASVAGTYPIGTATFGNPLSAPGTTAEVMPVVDQANGTGLACTALNAANTAAVKNKIAVVDRGTCSFVVKAANVQAAGAVGMIVADNAPGSASGMSGADPTIWIPSVRISQADGVALKAALATRSRLHSGMMANLGVNLSILAGGDSAGRVLMYAPNPYQGGSSVSHWDTSASPNQLMEPAINSDLTHEVTPPQDLTYMLLKDIGWQ